MTVCRPSPLENGAHGRGRVMLGDGKWQGLNCARDRPRARNQTFPLTTRRHKSNTVPPAPFKSPSLPPFTPPLPRNTPSRLSFLIPHSPAPP